MKKRTIIFLFIFTIGIIFATNFFHKKYSLDSAKENIITELEKYKASHASYPLELKDLGIDINKEFYYRPDSTKQSYILSYTKGVMGANTFTFDSKTGKWEEKFNY